MLGEFKLALLVENGGWVPNYYGYLFRAAILQKISEVTPDLSTYLHEGNLMRPYSLGVPYMKTRGKRVFRDRNLLLETGTVVEYPLKTLNERVTREMVKSVTLFKDLKLDLGGIQCIIGAVEFKTEKRPVIGNASPAGVTFIGSVKFRTPVAFTVKKSPYRSLWADPFTVVQNLLNIYQATGGGETAGEEGPAVVFDGNRFLDELEMHAYVRVVKGWVTREVPLGKNRKIIGAVGELEWAAGEEFPRDYLETVKKLLHFGFYSNAGANRTAGMGVFEYK